MKTTLRSLLGIVLGIFSISAYAQPVLTANGINPVINDQLSLVSSTYFNPGNAGANQTWNLSTMSVSAASTNTIIPVASAPSPGSYPGASMATSNGSSSHSYYKTSSSAWQFMGTHTPSAGVMYYSDPEDLLRFPFSFNNTYTDTWSTTFTTSTLIYRKGTTTVTADGYGTVTTPAGTFSNVMRVHFQQSYQDSFNLGLPTVITYGNDEYMWYLNGNHNPIAVVLTFTSSISSPIQSGVYMQNVVSNVEEKESSLLSFNVYPNPASNDLNFNINLKEQSEVTIEMFDITGANCLMLLNYNVVPGMGSYRVDVSELPPGMYFARLSLDGVVATSRRIIITK